MRANIIKKKLHTRDKRKKRIRSRVSGTSNRPRVCIYKSNRHIYVQAIDDVVGNTICASDGKVLGIKANKDSAKTLGKDFADKLKDKGIEEIVFDRNGYLYHGVVASFADTLRENGIKL